MSKLILVVDDEESIRISLGGILEDEGYQVLMAENGSDALDIIHEEVPDLVMLDIWMPGMDGIQTLERIRSLYQDLTVIMMSGHGTIETAVKATRTGAFDFIEKPFTLDKVLITIANALNFKELRKENEALRLGSAKEHNLIGSTSVIEALRSQIQRIAAASTPVLIQGEPGVGKELVARVIHHYSTRRNKPFVSVNCMSVPGDLLADELFGHEYDALRGTKAHKRGRLDLADGGTLFLDDIQELSLRSQGEILRIISEQHFERCGGTRPVRVDVRIIASTPGSLEQMVKTCKFREELLLELQVVPVRIPALRERREDIPQLVEHFIRQFHLREGWEPKHFDQSALDCLYSYNWPGNIRELKNIVERILIMAAGPVVTADILPELIPGGCCSASAIMESGLESCEEITESLQIARDRFEREFIEQTLKQAGWNINLAAQMLQLERTTLQRKLLQHGLTPNKRP